jgi:phosphate starvation-inducible membrane PsiE
MSELNDNIPNWESRSRSLCLRIERVLYLLVGIGLLCTAVVSLCSAVIGLLHIFEKGATFFSVIFHSVDNLLLALMFLEIFHTVEVVLRGKLHIACIEPFLFVGIIASVRRILIISLQTAHAENPLSQQAFQNAMWETAILGVLILILIAAVWVLRRSKTQTENAC